MAERGVTLIANLHVHPDYQALSEHRRTSTTSRFLTLVHDLPPRCSA